MAAISALAGMGRQLSSASTALALLHAANRAAFKDPLAFLDSGLVSGSTDKIAADIANIIAGSPDLTQQYQAEYDKILKAHPRVMGSNAAHVSMYETIVNNRGAFPPEGFIIHTDFPGGGSITSYIPAYGAGADAVDPSVEEHRFLAARSAQARIASVIPPAVLETGAASAENGQTTPGRVTGAYLTP